ncbi:hypothetical protein KSS87_008129 [Heliosperma pusillum]|nr:hypothetical protein KSS87_008129 [Heliosperma pusillum]
MVETDFANTTHPRQNMDRNRTKLSRFVTSSLQISFSGGTIRTGREILLQAFNWESHKHDWWRNLEKKVPDIAKSGFTCAWLPPASQSLSPEGYLPQDLYSLNSKYGSEGLLIDLLQRLKNHKIRAMADIVINHRVGTTQGHGGMYSRFDGLPLPWDEHAVTSCSGGLKRLSHASLLQGNQSTGDNFSGVPNIDHIQPFVRRDVTEWLTWLHTKVGFKDFRFDFARGYAAKYVKEYIERVEPVFCVGEYWDSCNYENGRLAYNQDSHRQRIIDWIDGTGKLATAFDFTTKGILQEAVKGELWRLRDAQGKPPGVVGMWPSRAVTFLDNHDTGSTQGEFVSYMGGYEFGIRNHTWWLIGPSLKISSWRYQCSSVTNGYAYILTHPGTPTVFYDHFFDWGASIHDQIVKLIDIRKHQDIHSRSLVKILEARPNLYSAIIGENVTMKIGGDSWGPAGREWKLATSGDRYAVWTKGN